jgi:hypothetical protein
MPETSARLGLPFIQPSQAQKHVPLNEALQRLDAVVQLSVVSFDAETPPAVPQTGDVHAVGANPIGDWAGHAHSLAIREETAWRFVAPGHGWRAWGQAEGALRVWDGSAWQPALDLQNIDSIGVGTTSDAANPLAVAGPATLLTHDGAGHQLKLNKAAANDTASLLYQSDWSGHAELGLTGDNNLHVKVSDDGNSWTEALVINGATGEISGAAVQADMMDTTAGRVLKTGNKSGPFDLGSSRTSVAEGSLNDLQNGGVTRFMAWNTGVTEVPWNYGVGLQIMAWETTGNQLAFRRGASPAMAFRGTVNSTPAFSDWLEVYHTGNAVGSVSATPGVGDALMERGSNANGTYMRLTDGTQICWHSLTLDAPSTAAGAGYEGATETAWTFPAAFAAGGRPVVHGAQNSDSRLLISATTASHSSATLRALRFTSSGVAPVVQVAAIGQWK